MNCNCFDICVLNEKKFVGSTHSGPIKQIICKQRQLEKPTKGLTNELRNGKNGEKDMNGTHKYNTN